MRTAIFSLLLLLTACGGHESEAKKKATPEAAAVAVQTAEAAESEWPETYQATGTVRARVSGAVASRVMAYVREVRAQVGDRVSLGQSLIVLDSRDMDAAYAQAEAAQREARAALNEVDNASSAAKAQLDLAETTFRRMKDLYGKKSISSQEFDEASAKLQMAKSNFEATRAKRTQVEEKIRQAGEGINSAGILRGYATIQAPFAGIVTERRVEPGNLATPGAPLLMIEQAGAYRLEAEVEESRMSVVRAGTPVGVTLEALDRELSARVSEVVPAVDPASRTFVARINLPANLALRTGMYGRASFRFGSRKVLAVSAGAVQKMGQVESVFVVEDGRARRRLVTTGAKSGSQLEILSGLRPGERIVQPVPATLEDGGRVEVRP
jgi:RND family efflux transporter MFP subunit